MTHLQSVKCGLTQRARGRLDSHRQIGFIRGFEFCPFRERVSSRQPPENASRWAADISDVKRNKIISEVARGFWDHYRIDQGQGT